MQDDLIAVTQADTVRAGELLSSVFGAEYARSDTNIEAVAVFLSAHRQQAEDAMRERCAAYIEGKGGGIPATTMFISLITGDRMPCMSGDGRDKLTSHKRRYFDDATRDLATAIRATPPKPDRLNGEGEK